MGNRLLPPEGDIMSQPVVHFEIIGRDPTALRGFYGRLFGWSFDTDSPVAAAISEAGNYGFIDRPQTGDGPGIPGGVGGGPGFAPHVIFYVGVDDVEEALQKAESLGGTRQLGPQKSPDGSLVVGHFTDPEGNPVGVAGPR
jgi:predicted enzyme related to lactoylglutathione lyase